MGTVTYPNAEVAQFVSERFLALKFNLKEPHPDFKEALGRGNGIGRGGKAGPRVEGVAAVARRVGEDREDPLGPLRPAVIVQVAALG